jgi:hypothetical protein
MTSEMEDASWWLVVESGSLLLKGSSFKATAGEPGLLSILSAAAKSGTEILIHGCIVEGLSMKAPTSILGVVNSTFRPDLPPDVRTVLPQDGRCGVQLLGRPLCDPRATCVAVSSGVRCVCAGDKLRAKPGTPDDGSKCLRDSSVDAMLLTTVVTLSIKKPGESNETLMLKVAAQGEAGFNGSYSTRFSLKRRDGSTFEANASDLGSFLGLQLRWQPQEVATFRREPSRETVIGDTTDIVAYALVPPQQQPVQLDSSKQIFSAEVIQLLSLRLTPCSDSTRGTCARDGDKFLAQISFSTSGDTDGDVIGDTVVLVAEVEAVASCNLSVVTLQHPTPLVADAPDIQVTVAALDVDSLPIVLSMPKFTVFWDGAKIPMRRSNGNLFVASIGPSYRDQGVHSLRVLLEDGWNAQLGTYAVCELLHREVVVEAKFNTAWIFVGSICACAVFVGALAYWVNKQKKQLGGIMMSVLTETMRLAMAVCLETGDLATDVRRSHCAIPCLNAFPKAAMNCDTFADLHNVPSGIRRRHHSFECHNIPRALHRFRIAFCRHQCRVRLLSRAPCMVGATELGQSHCRIGRV